MQSNFIDYVKFFGRSGAGGAGSVHFRREKFVPKGGPDGETAEGVPILFSKAIPNYGHCCTSSTKSTFMRKMEAGERVPTNMAKMGRILFLKSLWVPSPKMLKPERGLLKSWRMVKLRY